VRNLAHDVPAPEAAPIPEGTRVSVDVAARFVDRDLVCGGSPWRLLRLSGRSRDTVERWRPGGVVGAGEGRFARTLVQQGLVLPHFEKDLTLDDIDVVIPVVGDVLDLDLLLNQLVGFHVTVVDDGSSDADAIANCAKRHSVRYLRLDENAGPSSARNAAALESTRELLWFVDADVAIEKVRDVAQQLQQSFEDPLVAAVAPRVRGSGGASMRDHFEVNNSPLDMGGVSGLVRSGSAIGYVPSACLMVRRSSFGAGFDESLRIGEDVDLVWRLDDHGWLVRYDAEVVVHHRARGSWRSWWRQREGYGASTAELARRFGDRLAPLRADRWTFLAWLSVAAGRPALGARIVLGATRRAQDTFFTGEDDPGRAAREIVTHNMLSAGGPLARGAVRTYGVVILAALVVPRWRSRALALYALGTAWRWRTRPVRLADVPLAVADDLAYGLGVLRGAWQCHSTRTLTPLITTASMGVREIFGGPRAVTSPLDGHAARYRA
jgi:mycofactocin glycosyltransferase